MKDIVLAVYEEYNYAGESYTKLVAVFCADQAIPTEYIENYRYIIKAMQLSDLAKE